MKKRFIVSVFVALFATAVQAELLIGWDFDGVTATSTSMDSTTNVANMQAGSLNSGGSLVSIDRSDVAAYRNLAAADTPAGALSGNLYVEFTVAADSGYQFTLSSLDLILDDVSGSSGAGSYFVRSNLDNYTSDIVAPTLIPTDAAPANYGLTGFTDMSSVTFRVYAYDQTGAAGAFNMFIGFGENNTTDGLTDMGVNGTISVVPEPVTAGLLGTGAVLAFAIRKQLRL